MNAGVNTVVPKPLRVLVVEDDSIAAKAHAVYVTRVPQFVVAGVTGSGADAVSHVARAGVDLVLLDMNLPDVHGLDVVRALRAKGLATDVIAVTSARDLAVVQKAVSIGVVQYVLKPFTFAMLKERLEQYAAYRRELTLAGSASGQDEVDRLLATARLPAMTARTAAPAKGLTAQTLDQVVACLSVPGAGARSAAEVADAVGVSRVSARRYLEHLATNRLVAKGLRHRGSGRPEVEYRWLG